MLSCCNLGLIAQAAEFSLVLIEISSMRLGDTGSLERAPTVAMAVPEIRLAQGKAQAVGPTVDKGTEIPIADGSSLTPPSGRPVRSFPTRVVVSESFRQIYPDGKKRFRQDRFRRPKPGRCAIRHFSIFSIRPSKAGSSRTTLSPLTGMISPPTSTLHFIPGGNVKVPLTAEPDMFATAQTMAPSSRR